MKKNIKKLARASTLLPRAVEDQIRLGIAKSAYYNPNVNMGNPWLDAESVDKMEALDLTKWQEVVEDCRFFYQRDPLVSSAINKLVEIGINDLHFSKNGISENELKIYEGIKDKLLSFARNMAREYFLSGLVIPEVSYTAVTKDKTRELGIKMKESLTLPTSMWLRNSSDVEIKASMFMDEPSYFVKIPDDLVYFILNKGVYKYGTKDLETYKILLEEYSDFVEDVKNGVRKIKLDNKLIFRGVYLTNSPYPIPYLYSTLESLKHKRNLRRMDYTLASRVISAIQLIKLGSDDFPVTEDDQDLFDDIRSQMTWRYSSGKDIERVFQLFGNHTLQIEWVFPPVEALLDDTKYANVNKDIIQGLGIPNLLISGETERSGAGGANDFAMFSPQSTMNVARDYIINVLQKICYDISKFNGIKSTPIIKFKPINLYAFDQFRQALMDLYTTGNLSRETYSGVFGFDWLEEMDNKEVENKVLETKKLEQFAPRPFSNQPNQNVPNQEEPVKNTVKTDKKEKDSA